MPAAVANAETVLKTERIMVDVRIDLAARNLNSFITWNVELPLVAAIDRSVALPIKVIFLCQPS